MKAAATPDRTHNPSDEASRVSCLRENLTSSSEGEGLETGRRWWPVPRQSFTRQLAIKRLKSVLDLDQLRAKQGSPLADVWLHGKLLYALVIEKYARSRVSDDWSRLERQRPATWWRVWKIIRREVAEWIIGVLHWRQDQWQACFEVMQERSRRRKLQALPEGINPLLGVCRKAGLCAM